MDSDRIMVMDAGRIAEFDEGHRLLLLQDGIFRSIVEQTGPATTNLLKNMALQTYLQKRRLERAKKAEEETKQQSAVYPNGSVFPEVVVLKKTDVPAYSSATSPQTQTESANEAFVV